MKIHILVGPGSGKTTLASLLRWADKYPRENLPEIRKILEPHAEKLLY